MQRVALAMCLACTTIGFSTLSGCSGRGTAAPASASSTTPRLYSGMGPHTRTVTTRSTEAQQYFNQGLTWTYAFNHDEAIRSFEAAAASDPSCAMAWWGVALCHGPHINFPMMPEERSRAAWSALQNARANMAGATPVERSLVEALSARYAWPPPEDRRSLDEAYADAMQDVHERYPDDADVATLYAESLMDLQPWDLWSHAGEPKGRTLEIVALLEGVLAKHPRHPGAAHLYIHAVEASRSPERALAAADALRDLVPASGHLLHMPSHIDVRVGQWNEAAEANRKAITTDTAYRQLSPRQNFYRVYMMHNEQFLSFVCMMQGRSEESIQAGAAAIGKLPPDWIRENASAIDGYMTVHMDALKRFGKWDEILALPAPAEHLPFTTAMWRCNRAIAYAAKGRVEQARKERELFLVACTRVPPEAIAQINPAERVLTLARHVLNGEIAYAERDYHLAEQELRAALPIEDALLYMEPPDWMVPVRHTLGAVLVDAGRHAEAEQAYREDLTKWPENGWSLLGLSRVLEKQGKLDEAATVRQRLERAWAQADVKPHASCLCAPKTASAAAH